MRTRLVLGAIGLLGISWGAWTIFRRTDISKPGQLAEWLIGTLILHDGVLVPATLVLGFVLTVAIPARARRYLQGGLISIGLVASISLVLIHREGDQQESLSLLRQDYTAHLLVLVAIIAGVTLLAYACRVVRDRRQLTSSTKVRSSAVHEPVKE
jgi:hypothetical protein